VRQGLVLRAGSESPPPGIDSDARPARNDRRAREAGGPLY